MATFIHSKVKSRQKRKIIYNTSDWHVGSLAFHEDAFNELRDMIIADKAWWTFGGDAIEGKKVDSPHFNPDGLDKAKLTIKDQRNYLVELIKPIASRLLVFQRGNHELYTLPDIDVVEDICEGIGRPDAYGDYQTWLDFCGMSFHFWHGRPTMPRGAKDPIQRKANQMAWLKNRFENLAGSCHAHYMGHTHQCMIVPPIEQYALLNSGENVKGVYFTEKPVETENGVWIPKDARWYVNTGTLRRGGQFGYEDYSEIAGYTPPVMACTKTIIEDGAIVDIEKVIF
jgi:hypothetical protein